MKVCSKCNQEKKLEEYYNSKSCIDNKMQYCKICHNGCMKKYQKKAHKKYKLSHKEYIKEYNDLWRLNNKDYAPLWYLNNKDKINTYQKLKKQNDPLYKLSACIRTNISQSLTGYSKSKSTLNILGLNNFGEFRIYIESLFKDNMNWSNYGFGEEKWVIDHRIPLASATTEQDIYRLNHHSNLQPMWWHQNMIKGAKII